LQRCITGIDCDVRFEIEHALEFPQGHVEQMADAGRQSLKKPNVRTGTGQFDVAQPLASNFGKRNFNTALVADDTAMFHPLIFAAETFPVRHRTENTCAKQTILLRFEGSVVDGLGFGDFTMRPRANLFWGSQTDPDAVKIGD